MNITKELFEQKNTELALKLASASIDERPLILEKLNELSLMQREYESLKSRFEALFGKRSSSVEIEITNGAIAENYLNLRKVLLKGLAIAEGQIHISFPGLPLNDTISEIKTNGYLRNRAVARRFYEMADIRQGGKKILFTKVGPNDFTIEVWPPVHDNTGDGTE